MVFQTEFENISFLIRPLGLRAAHLPATQHISEVCTWQISSFPHAYGFLPQNTASWSTCHRMRQKKKMQSLPPKVCRFQEKLFLGVQISILPLPLPKLRCPNISHWQRPSGPPVKARHHVQLLHLPPTSWSQWLFLLDLRDPGKKKKNPQNGNVILNR